MTGVICFSLKPVGIITGIPADNVREKHSVGHFPES